MPPSDKSPWKIEGVKALIGVIAAVVLGITSGAWVMYGRVNRLNDEVASLRAQVVECDITLKKFQDERWENMRERVARLEAMNGLGPLPSKDAPKGPTSSAPAPNSNQPNPAASPPTPGPAANSSSPPPSLSASTASKAAVTAEGVTAEVVRTKKTANGVVFQVRITSPERKSMIFYQRFRDMASRASLNDRGPQNLLFADREDAPESQRRNMHNVAVNPGSPMVFYAFAPGDVGPGTGSCRELQLVARASDNTVLNFVLTGFPLD